MKQFRQIRLAVCLLALAASPLSSLAADNPFLGHWALTIPGGAAGWLGVRETGGRLDASLLWGWGSVTPVESAKVANGELVLTRKHEFERKDTTGKKTKHRLFETIVAKVTGDDLQLTSTKPREDGSGEDRATFSGKRQPPLPPRPDLAKVKWGEPKELFNGRDLSGWRLTDPNAVNGWSVKDGFLVNNPVQKDGQPHINYGNLRTDAEFEDFNLKLEVRLAEGGNSGVYLRGIYEIQVADSFGRQPESHIMAALYSRVAPSRNACKPAGQWQTMDLTLVNRHVTVILNGEKVLDAVAVEGCTGGALWSDVSRPGPIYFQGDHTGVEYRNVALRPALK